MELLFQWLNHFDVQLFRTLNFTLTNRYFDFIMPVLTNKQNWVIPGGVILVLLFWRGGPTGRVLALLLIPTLILSDQLSSAVLKPLVGRLRPCKTLDMFRLLIHCGSRYGFPSGHATNIAAAAFLLTVYFKRWRALAVFIVILVGYSRIYVGVHYPLDVAAGYLLGIFCAGAVLLVYNHFVAKKLPDRFRLPPVH